MLLNLPTKEEQRWETISNAVATQLKALDFIVASIQELQETRAVEVLQWAMAMVPEHDKHVITRLIVQLMKAEKAIQNVEDFNTPTTNDEVQT